MKKKIKIRTIFLMFVLVFTFIKINVGAASYTGQETEMTLLASVVGRYTLNYTGNTNHYATWNTEGIPLGNAIYNDVGGYLNSSTATLNQSSGSNKIKYAFLVWETRSPDGATAKVRFITPKGEKYNISPNYAINDWRDSGNGSWAYSTMYCMATDVTSIVKNAGYGNYTVCNIPRWEPTTMDSSGKYPGGESPGSWQLIVVEEGDSLPVRAVSLKMGSKFKMGGDYNTTARFNSGLKSKVSGSASGQIFFGASNSSSNAPMTENVATYNDGGGLIKDVISHTTYSPGLYRNGKVINGRDSGNGCIRMSLSDVSDIGNSAKSVKLDVRNESWTTFFFLGFSMDIAFPDFNAAQTTTVKNATSVTVNGSISNVSQYPNTGIYNGNLVVNLDDGLAAIPGKAIATVNGRTQVQGSVSGHTVTFGGAALASMMQGESISYSIECSVSAEKNVFNNSDSFSGYLRSDGINTNYWIDNACTSRSSAERYIISFNGNGATSGSMSDIVCGYGVTGNLPANAFARTGHTFTGWSVNKNGTGTTYADRGTYQCTGNVTLYAQWKKNSYDVGVSAGTGIESVSGGGRYEYDSTVTISASVKPGYHWHNWTGTYNADNITWQFKMPANNVDMTANAEANAYSIIFDPNDGGEVTHLDNIETHYDADVTLPNGADFYQKYTLDGVNVTNEVLSGELALADAGVESETLDDEEAAALAEGEVDTVDAEKAQDETVEGTETVETAGSEPIATDESEPKPGNDIGQSNTESEGTEEGALLQAEPAPAKKVYPSVFMGWSLEDGKNSFIPKWKVSDVVKNLTEENNGAITLYAVWDDCPWIQAEDLYYTLEQAQSGYITQEEILSHATASDREDGSPIAPGFHEDGTSFSIPDYSPADFTQFQHEGSSTENLTVVDSTGSVYYKQITVYVVDTTAVAVEPVGTTRFINEYYYNQPYEYGGLADNSIWKTDPEYRAVLQSAFNNIKNDTPERVYEFSHEDMKEMRRFVEENGMGNSKSPDALRRFYDQFMEPNRTK